VIEVTLIQPAQEYQGCRSSGAGVMTPQHLLRLHPFFGALTDKEGQALLATARYRELAAGEVLFLRGDPTDGLYGVLAGTVLMVVDSSAGKELVLARHGAGEIFGEVSLLDGGKRSATAVAYEASRLVHIARERLLDFLKDRPDTMLRVVQVLCARMRRLTELAEDSLFLEVSARLARRIMALAATGSATRQPGGTVTLHLSQNDVARMLGVSREIVSKHLVLWREAGIVELGRRRLTIHDSRALACLGEGKQARGRRERNSF
jgi:CRP-like cAMP-binding protein